MKMVFILMNYNKEIKKKMEKNIIITSSIDHLALCRFCHSCLFSDYCYSCLFSDFAILVCLVIFAILACLVISPFFSV
jgi:hypothetical protein